ncbi:kinase-like domain-containing protein [Glomus cerebriforme]|uniref:Kinase-like domain-containing protein n=1 Tax=Glomus cerebriforme TaxID=658196 RepID=A0A397S554_9GLOM|nr:kinase-like domain-containing protein [Glomus cerebriforme]
MKPICHTYLSPGGGQADHLKWYTFWTCILLDEILEGKRETPTPNTPIDYVNIYTKYDKMQVNGHLTGTEEINSEIENHEVNESDIVVDDSSHHQPRIVESFNEFAPFIEKFISAGDEITYMKKIQVNILRELKDSDHIIRFFGVAHEDSKYYLVTVWMEYGNLYVRFRDNINWDTKIIFALDICCGIMYLHECKILNHNIQSANILINSHYKVKIANFILKKWFLIISHNLDNLERLKYMALEVHNN